MTLQVEQTGFGSSVQIINADTHTALRSCGMEEAVRDTVLADTSPSARWNLVACEGNWFACRPASDDTEVQNALVVACCHLSVCNLQALMRCLCDGACMHSVIDVGVI